MIKETRKVPENGCSSHDVPVYKYNQNCPLVQVKLIHRCSVCLQTQGNNAYYLPLACRHKETVLINIICHLLDFLLYTVFADLKEMLAKNKAAQDHEPSRHLHCECDVHYYHH